MPRRACLIGLRNARGDRGSDQRHHHPGDSRISFASAASEKDIDVAVAAARNAFKTTWGKNVTGFERAHLINKLADLIERDAQELAELESLNNGKPVKLARYY